MSFASVTRIYDVSARATATREVVAAPLVRRFSSNMYRLTRALGDSAADEIWVRFLRRCRRSLRDLVATPLSPAHRIFELNDSIDYLAELTARARSAYAPEILARADLCIASVRDLARDTTNPLGARAVDVLRTGELHKSGLIVKSRHIDEVRVWLTEHAARARFFTDHDLVGMRTLESLVAIGPAYLFPPSILGAPRAEMTCFVQFDFIRDRDPETRLFTGTFAAPGVRIRSVPESESALADDDQLDVATLVPTIDWDALAIASRSARAPSGEDREFAEANLFLLAGGFAVYLEAVDGPRIDVVIDLEPGVTPRLRSERTRAIVPGDHVVLRSAGGAGDYIPSVADDLLKHRAGRLRALQAEWKRALRTRVKEQGFSAVEHDLRALGMGSPNLQYRLWHNSIRTRDPNDFRILMQYLGLGHRAAEIWDAMGEIVEAHLRAGQQVRKLLEDAVVAADVGDLITTGRVDVSLQQMNAGTLSVLRVDGRAPAPHPVPEDELRLMTRIEADLWPG